MKEIKQIIHAFEEAEIQGQKTALATVVHVEGSSYRAPGARMLIRDDGLLTGAISGGCLEGDALRKALMVIMRHQPLLVTYNTTDEENAVIGINLGCNGVIRVLIEPVDPEDPQNPIALLKRAVQEKAPAVLVTFFSLKDHRDMRQGTKWQIKQDALNTQNIFPGPLPGIMKSLPAEVKKVFEEQHSAFITFNAASSATPDDITAFIEYVKPGISLVIAGAGNDVLPVVQMAKWMGWETTLIDGRPKYANTQRFAGCQIIIAEPEKAFLDAVITPRTACLLMSHNYHYDKAMLQRLSQYQVPYIGILGPKKKWERMRDDLGKESIVFSPEQLSGIYSPIGLDIGAETPEEIACAVVAEINSVFAGRGGISLRALNGKIHRRNAAIEEVNTTGKHKEI